MEPKNRPFALIFLLASLCVLAWVLWQNTAHKPQALGAALKSHRAMYDVTLVKLSSSGNLVGLKGLMVYEWRKGCGFYTTSTHSTLTYAYADGQIKTVNADMASQEAADGKRLLFSTRRETGGQLDADIAGIAENGAARFTKPTAEVIDLPQGTMFPMQHTLAAYEHAVKGDTQFLAHLFDGADVEGPMLVNTLISPPKEVAPPADDLHLAPELLSKTVRPYSFSFFKDTADDALPEYEMKVEAQDNGVVRALDIQYDDFGVRQTLKALQPLEDAPCSPKTN